MNFISGNSTFGYREGAVWLEWARDWEEKTGAELTGQLLDICAQSDTTQTLCKGSRRVKNCVMYRLNALLHATPLGNI